MHLAQLEQQLVGIPADEVDAGLSIESASDATMLRRSCSPGLSGGLRCGRSSIAKVGLADEVVDRLAEPVVATRGPLGVAHALLHDAPLPMGRVEERMVVQLIAVLHGGGVDLGAHL